MIILLGLLAVPCLLDKPTCLFQCNRGEEKGRTCNLVCSSPEVVSSKAPTTTTTEATTKSREDRNPTSEKPHCMFNCARGGGSERECNLVCTGMNVVSSTTKKSTTKEDRAPTSVSSTTERTTTTTRQNAKSSATTVTIQTESMTTTQQSSTSCALVCRRNGGSEKDCELQCTTTCLCNAPTPPATTATSSTAMPTTSTTTTLPDCYLVCRRNGGTEKACTIVCSSNTTPVATTTTSLSTTTTTSTPTSCDLVCHRQGGTEKDCNIVCNSSTTTIGATTTTTTTANAQSSSTQQSTSAMTNRASPTTSQTPTCNFVCMRNGQTARACSLVCTRIFRACNMICSRQYTGRSQRACNIECDSFGTIDLIPEATPTTTTTTTKPRLPKTSPTTQTSDSTPTSTTPTTTTPSHSTPTPTPTSDVTTSTSVSNGCSNTCEACPSMQWKGGKYSTLMYEAHNAFVLRMNVPNTAADNNIRTRDEYSGFLIFSRRWCGVDFLEGLLNGAILISLTDQESMYDVIDMHHRTGGHRNRDSVTIQYRQNRSGAIRDLPGSSRKDQFMLLLVSADSIAIKNKDKCFKIQTGVLPNYYNTADSWAECAGDQRDVGY